MTTIGTSSTGDHLPTSPITDSFAMSDAGDLYGRESGAASPPSSTHHGVSTPDGHADATHKVHAFTVRQDAERSRYDALADGDTVGHLAYAVEGMYLDITHTEVEPAWQGRGLAGQLVHAALQDVRAGVFHGVARVKPTCPYVQRWLSEHPEFSDLRA